jgi:hypothetical protein
LTNENDSFFQEVDERLREDKVLSATKRYGPYVLGLLIAILLGVGAWQGWVGYTRDQSQDQSTDFFEAQRQAREGELEDAATAFQAMSEKGPRVYRVMAMMEHAATLEVQGDLQAALAGFDQAAEAASDPMMRDTARLRAAYIVADTQDFQAVQTRLAPLLESDGHISALAKELLAVEAWEAGDSDLARDTFETLTLAFDAPESVRQRAQLGLAVLGPAPEPAATAPSEPAAPAPADGETK